jgi:cytochrome c peroxidase
MCRYHYEDEGDDQAISDSAKRGEVLLFSQPLSCFRCHGGFNFSDATDFQGRRGGQVQFHDTGLYDFAGPLSYLAPNVGIYENTFQPEEQANLRCRTDCALHA